MPQILWDASALAKRYYPEIGSGAVNAVFAMAPAVSMLTTFLGYAETAAVLLRKRNQGNLNQADFASARLVLRQEVLAKPDFGLLSIDDAATLSGIALSDRHNLNSTDAAILETFLRYVRTQLPASPVCVLAASDQRLLRAAHAEGLKTLNPELLAAADIPAFFAGI